MLNMFNTGKFAGKTIVITGASRGIGREIALKIGKDGANVAIFAKTASAHEKLPGTIYTVAEEVEKIGGKALPVQVDIRDEAAVAGAVEQVVKKFNGVDILINNASAISLTGTLETPMKRYDLMHAVNVRGTFLVSQKCIPYLKQAKNPHILNLSPPLLMESQWFAHHVAYTMTKFGMSMCVLGMSEEFCSDGIAVNALWPQTAIWTAAMDMLSGGMGKNTSRKPSIVSDAAYAILSRNSRDCTGNFFIDENILKEEGIKDFGQYAYDQKATLSPDFFIPNIEYQPPVQTNENREKSRETISNDPITLLSQIKGFINSELVGTVKAIYLFNVNVGDEVKPVYLDLKNGEGSIGSGQPPEEPRVTMDLTNEVFAALMKGEMSPTRAFLTKKLKIKGSMGKAMQLEGILSKIVKKN